MTFSSCTVLQSLFLLGWLQIRIERFHFHSRFFFHLNNPLMQKGTFWFVECQTTFMQRHFLIGQSWCQDRVIEDLYIFGHSGYLLWPLRHCFFDLQYNIYPTLSVGHPILLSLCVLCSAENMTNIWGVGEMLNGFLQRKHYTTIGLISPFMQITRKQLIILYLEGPIGCISASLFIWLFIHWHKASQSISFAGFAAKE